MQTRLLVSCLSLALLAFSNQADARNCHISRFHFNVSSEGPWPARMMVKQGQSCGSRQWHFGSTAPSRLYLADQARHGKVVLNYPATYRYVPAAGYVGNDSFTLRVCGTKNGGYQGCANILFDVAVATDVP